MFERYRSHVVKHSGTFFEKKVVGGDSGHSVQYVLCEYVGHCNILLLFRLDTFLCVISHPNYEIHCFKT